MQTIRSTWLEVVTILGAGLALAMGASCQSTDGTSRDSNCSGESMGVEGRDYCIYDQSKITETGFQCPQSHPHRHRAKGVVVCSKKDGSVPDEHERTIEKRHGSSEDWMARPEDDRTGSSGGRAGRPPSGCPDDDPTGRRGAADGSIASFDAGATTRDVAAPLPPDPTIRLKPDDGRTATRSTSSPRIVFQWNQDWAERNGGITRQTLRKVADNVTLRTWPDFNEVSATTAIGSIPNSGQRREVTIEVIPGSRLGDQWYALQLSGAPVAFDWGQDVPTLSNGERGVRFHPTSNPRLQYVRTCEKRDGTKLIVRFSEPIQGNNRPVTDAIVLSQGGRTLDRRERSTDHGMTAVPRRFSRGRPVTIEIRSGLESSSGTAVEPTTHTFTPKCESGCTRWKVLLK